MKQIEFATPDAVARKHVFRHRKWIEETLGAPLAESVQLRMADPGLAQLAIGHVLHGILPLDVHQSSYAALSAKIRRVTLPPNVLPSLGVRQIVNSTRSDRVVDEFLQTEWQDCPVGLHLESMPVPIVVLKVPYNLQNMMTEWQELTILRRESVAGLFALIQECASYRTPSIQYFGGEKCTIAPACWNDIVMDPSATKLLCRDFETFFRRKAWFHANNLPFRRGYLLHGPPGNGKTSAIRAMLSYPSMSGHAINLKTWDMDDSLLQKFFVQAANQAPALIVLEDIDRIFFGAEEEKPHISLQQLLNCLDGVDTQDGVIVVATANHPEVLDSAILRRPGRFDRVVEFANPAKELRAAYLQKMCVALIGEALDRCVGSSEGLSFAQLRESYILAGQAAFEQERDITADDVTSAIALLQETMNKADRKRTQKSGFDL